MPQCRLPDRHVAALHVNTVAFQDSRHLVLEGVDAFWWS
jgi:hypothetical protein